jgi:hypothetical protein
MTETTYQAVGSIDAVAVAKKLEAIRNHEYPELLAQLAAQPRLPEMMVFLEYIAMQPGGMVKFCADTLELLPERFGTETMRAARKAEYTLQEKDSIYSEIPYKYNPAHLRDPDQESAESEFLAARTDYYEPPDPEKLARDRREFQDFLKAWTAQEIRKVCSDAAMENLPRYLEDLCVKADKGFKEPEAPLYYENGPYWFMDDPVAVVFEMMDRRAKEVSKRLAMTAVAKKVFDALDYALQERVTVRIEGDSRFGKTEAGKAHVEIHPGLERRTVVPESNSLSDFLRAIADSLGIAYSCGTGLQVLREKIRYVQRQFRCLLLLDESHYLVPQNYTKTTPPQRLNWVRAELIDMGFPVALIHTPQTFLPDVDKFVGKTKFAMQQFFGRIYRSVRLPDELDRPDLLAVARIHFPEFSDEYLEVIADLAELSENYLQTVEAVAKLARYIARREGHRRITVSDIETAAGEIIPRRAVPVPEPDATSGTKQRPVTRRTPLHVAERAVKAPLKAASRAVRASRIALPETGSMPEFSSQRGSIDRVETDLVPAEA